MSYPTTLYLDEDLNLLSTVPGYMAPQDAEPILSYFVTNSFKTTSLGAVSKELQEHAEISS
jgi:thioredoxin-related protein